MKTFTALTIALACVLALYLFAMFNYDYSEKSVDPETMKKQLEMIRTMNHSLTLLNIKLQERLKLHRESKKLSANLETVVKLPTPAIRGADGVSHPIRSQAKSAIIFTMDSIESYKENSLAGGAAGAFSALVYCY